MIAPLKVSTNHIATTFSNHLDAAGGSDRRKMGELPVLIGKRDLASQDREQWSTPTNF